MEHYGKELILDLYGCDSSLFNRKTLKRFFDELCNLLDMEICDLYFWDDEGVPEEEKQTDPNLKGTSAIQFIMTSNITIHTLDLRKEVYLNVFSCKDFSAPDAEKFCKSFFKATHMTATTIDRG